MVAYAKQGKSEVRQVICSKPPPGPLPGQSLAENWRGWQLFIPNHDLMVVFM